MSTKGILPLFSLRAQCMPRYALHYFQRAAALRPTDPRMWCAMGQCYEVEQVRSSPPWLLAERALYDRD